MTKSYKVSRQLAAKSLGVSTRTIDRYIKGGKLSYKKVANKVLLAQEEIDNLKEDFSALRQEANTEIVGGNPNYTNSTSIKNGLEEAIDEKIDKFFLVFKEKDKVIEEKNKVIFMLQQRIGEIETKLNNMIALPDYNKEKQEAMLEKEKLENKIKTLRGKVKNEKNKNLIFIGLAMIFIVLALFMFMKG